MQKEPARRTDGEAGSPPSRGRRYTKEQAEEKDDQIIKMACLKAAGSLLSGSGSSPDECMEVAEYFHAWVTGKETIPEEEPIPESWVERIRELAAEAAALSNGARWNGHHFDGHLEKHYEVTCLEALNKRQANVLALTLKCESKMARAVVRQWQEKLLEQLESLAAALRDIRALAGENELESRLREEVDPEMDAMALPDETKAVFAVIATIAADALRAAGQS